jgi:hypothetical protein
MQTKPDNRNDVASVDSAVVAVPGPVTSPSNGNGAHGGADASDSLWQSGAKALSRSLDEWRIGWNRLTSWTRGKLGSADDSGHKPD